MRLLFIFIATILLLNNSCSEPKTTLEPEPAAKSELILSIGLVADPQYEDRPNFNTRNFRKSLLKLNEAIDTFNHSEVDFIQTLGDVIESGWNSFDSIIPIYQKINPNIKNYHLLGNHEFSVNPVYFDDLLERLSMPNFYYSYSKNGWRFIVLDATDFAYYSNSLHNHDSNLLDAFFNATEGNPNNKQLNGAIGQEQQDWLKQELEMSRILNQKVIIYSHMPLRPLGRPTNLWNNHAIIEIIENSSNVFAFINGHHHPGGYIFKNDIHYITIRGMVDAKENAYGILKIYNDSVLLKGFGNQQTIKMANQ